MIEDSFTIKFIKSLIEFISATEHQVLCQILLLVHNLPGLFWKKLQVIVYFCQLFGFEVIYGIFMFDQSLFMQDLQYWKIVFKNLLIFVFMKYFKSLVVWRKNGWFLPGLKRLEDRFCSEKKEMSLDILIFSLFGLTQDEYFPKCEL